MRAVVVLLVRIVLERDHLVLGEPPGALKVQIVAPGARAVHLAASVGRVSDPRPLAGTGDTFEATFEAPSERYPQVAVLGAWDEAGGVAIAVLPLWGAARLPVQVDAPQANITLVVGGRRFGGIADGHGRAEIAFVAPPGLRNGTVSAIDRLGNMRHREVPLGIPDAPRLLIEGGPDELLADGRTATRLVCFGATPEAQPEPALRVRAPGAEVRPLGVGIAEVIVPPRRDLGPVTVTAEASGQSRSRTLRFVAGPPADILAQARRTDVPDGYLITARVVDAASHGLALAPTGSGEGGTLGPFESTGDGSFAARYVPAPGGERGAVVLRAGSVERRLELEPVSAARLHWEVRGAFTSNLAHLFAGGALVGVARPFSRRLFAGLQTGLLFASGSVPLGDGRDSDFQVLLVPVRAVVGVPLPLRGPWQPFVDAHGGAILVAASARVGPSSIGPALAEHQELEVALDLGFELGAWWRLGPGALTLSAGYDYAPVEQGTTVKGTVAGAEVGVGWRGSL